MRKVLLLLLLFPVTVLGSTAISGLSNNPSSTPADADKMIDETGSNTYLQSYLNDAKYVVGKLGGDCTVNTSTFAVTCTKINGLTFPALVSNDCIASNAGATALVMVACGSGGGAGTFDGIGTGTNVTATMTVGTGASLSHSGTGSIDANYANGTAIPTTTPLIGTNASGQFVAELGVQLAVETYAAINAIGCAAGNAGSLYYITDSNVAVGSTITAGSGSNKVLALCNGSVWVAH